jgi:hypothetical protein
MNTNKLEKHIRASLPIRLIKLLFSSGLKLSFAVLSLALQLESSLAQPFRPPPKPEVTPLIGKSYPNDRDGDQIDDQLFAKAVKALAAQKSALTQVQRAQAQANLDEMIDVELVFLAQITQKQIDDFLAQGGEITYVYKAVSYGWNGRIPLEKVAAIPALMGASLVLVQEAVPMQWHMDTATRAGRVRPIWASGFAGNPAGYNGDSTITIGIVDTGVDETHADLNGRRVYWHDFSSDGFASPTDLIQHGSHVAGIALGTGAAGGSGTGTMSYTDEGTLSGVPSGSFYASPIELPAASVTYTATARWSGGGSTTLYLIYHTKGVSGGWTAQSSVAGSSPLTLSVSSFVGVTTRAYSAALLQNTGRTITDYVIANQVTSYPGVGDGFNKFSGVSPGCNWAGAKVFNNAGSGTSVAIGAGIDDLVANRIADNIKVMNLSLGTIGNPGINTTHRQKVNTAVNNGIVVAVSAGNDGGTQQVDDPGRAAMALTVAAANDVNQLTEYTSEGFASPGSTAGLEEDYKPDLMAPGGSQGYYSAILSVDSNSGDGAAFADQQANDYYNIQGTSMASPFAAGCAALVIDALQQTGVTWDFSSSQHSRYVKMVLCATASESNSNRESGAYNPTLQRATAGPNGFPAGKDQYEGYGMINPDAAVEAVSQTYTQGSTINDTLGPTVTDRRVWARTVALVAGQSFIPTLTVPAGGDFDLYLYSGTPSAYGTPTLLASSTSAGTGGSETFTYTAASSGIALIVVKRVSGSGTFTLTTPDVTPPTVTINQAAGQADPSNGSPINFSVVFSESVADFATGDVTLSGTAGSTTATVTGSGTTYNVAVSGMTGNGTVIATVAAGVAHDAAGNANTASTSTDNTVTFTATVSIAGTVAYYPAVYPTNGLSTNRVGGVAMNLTGDANQSVITLADGSYGLSSIPAGGTYTVTPSKTDDSTPANGITVADLGLIQAYVLGKRALDPYQLLAADVNTSSSITVADLGLIQALILGKRTTFPAGLWRFVPADYSFPIPTSPWTAPNLRGYPNQTTDVADGDFVAIKLGDVNHSWQPPAGLLNLLVGSPKTGTTLAAAAMPRVAFGVSEQSVPAGQTVSVPVTVNGFSRVTSAQFSLNWNPAVLRYLETRGYGLKGLSAGSFGTTLAESGKLAFAWYDAEAVGVALADGAVLFSVSFEVIGKAGSVSAVALVDSPTPQEVSVEFGETAFGAKDGSVAVFGPRVMVSNSVYADGQFRLSVATEKGRSYTLEFTESLAPPHWTALPAVVGDGTLAVMVDPGATNQQRFYRVRVE